MLLKQKHGQPLQIETVDWVSPTCQHSFKSYKTQDHLHILGVYSAAGFQVKLQRKQMQFVVQVKNFQYFYQSQQKALGSVGPLWHILANITDK